MGGWGNRTYRGAQAPELEAGTMGGGTHCAGDTLVGDGAQIGHGQLMVGQRLVELKQSDTRLHGDRSRDGVHLVVFSIGHGGGGSGG